MITSQETKTIQNALQGAKNAVAQKRIEKSATNPFFGSTYLSLDDIQGAVDPILDNYGLSLTQWPDQTSSGEPALTTRIAHQDGEWIESTAALSISKKDPQAQGSAITYMKRYAYVAILGIRGVEPDDDGNLASQPDSKVTRTGKPAQAGTSASRTVAEQRQEMEQFAVGHLKWSKAKLTKWYHDSFGVDYKSDTDEANLAKAIASLALKDE